MRNCDSSFRDDRAHRNPNTYPETGSHVSKFNGMVSCFEWHAAKAMPHMLDTAIPTVS